MSKKLYFDTSEANNLDKNSVVDTSIATPSNVKINYVFKDAITKEQMVGTMTINPDVSIKIDPKSDSIPNNYTYTIPEGYHSGNSKIYVGELKDYTKGNTTPEEVVNNKIFWVNGERKVGTLDVEQAEQIADATAEDIAEGKTAWVNKNKITGVLKRLPRKDKTLKAGESYNYPEGISAGTTIISAASLESQTEGTATSEGILSGLTAWVNGIKVTGVFNFISKLKEYLSSSDVSQKEVLSGKKFYSSKYEQVVSGTMPNHSGEPYRYIDLGTTYSIPLGYYDGITAIKTKPLSEYTVGSAMSSNILSNKTAWVNGIKITGSMPINSTISETINAGETYTIPEGYHNGSGKVISKSLDAQTKGDVKDTEIVNGKVAWVNGNKVIGIMPDNGAVYELLSAGKSYHVPNGYHSGAGIISAKSIEEETPGTAESVNILIDKIAWVNGKQIIGSMIDNSGWNKDNVEPGDTIVIPEGYHDGKGIIVTKTKKEVTPGTANNTDILLDKIAWVNGEQVTGILELSGDASAEDVISGKTFYNVNAKSKVTGILELSGTATESSVLKGETFYTTNPKRKLIGSLELTGDAIASKVLEGMSFYTTDPTTKVIGTMSNVGPINMVLDAGETYTIPEGYHSGTGKVSSKALPVQTEGTAEESDILISKTAWVNGEKIIGTLELLGDAQPSEVVAGKKYYSDNAKNILTGEMVNNGSINVTISAGEKYYVDAGYHNGYGTVTAKDLASQTIGTADGTNILDTKIAWVNGKKVTGSMPNRGNWSSTELIAGNSISIPLGYHNGSGTITAKDLASQTEGTATDNQIIVDRTAWVNGTKIIGTMPDNTGWESNDIIAGESVTIPEGYHNGSHKVSAKDLASQTVADAIESDILLNKTAWVNGTKVTGNIPVYNTTSLRVAAGHSVTLPAGYFSNDIIIYSIYTDKLDLTGTDAEYESNDEALLPNSAGYVDESYLIITDVPL